MTDLEIALNKLQQLQQEDDDLGSYWLSIADLLKLNHGVQTEAERFAACRHQARYMQEDGGEKAFVKAVDDYRKLNHL